MKYWVHVALMVAFAANAQRVPWTSSRIRGSPEPPAPFVVERVFDELKFSEPTDLVAFPGLDRLVIAEHAGKIYSFPKRGNVQTPDLFADMKDLDREIREVYSVEFHPGFASNRFVYVFYVLKADLPNGTHISRFKVTEDDPPQIDLGTEQVIISWRSGGHNGGCIRFGPDGYLYIATGDAAGPNPPDPLDTGQDISDLLSAILRIDVDRATNGRAYSIPSDNPFNHTPGARPEIWAYGFRNPWRMSFDPVTGALWAADVGWELWEMVYRVERGGNYGWSLVEGTRQPIRPNSRKGPTPILPPIMEHSHAEAASITGGYVYRGKRFPELAGSYIYGDWETGKIWELLHDGKRVVRSRELVDTALRIITFGQDQERELYIVDYNGGIYQLAPNPNASKRSSFPHKLSETGLFTREWKAMPGVEPYSINAERWADGAQAERWLGLPGDTLVTNNQEGKWVFPKDAVLAKTYARAKRRIETQVLHFTGESWNAYSYAWDQQQGDATLVDASGKEEAGWRFLSRAECLRCHNSWCNTVLSFDPLQLRPNALAALIQPTGPSKNLPTALVDPYDSGADLHKRARSYLHVNCSPCHRENAGGSVASLMNYQLRLEKAHLVGVKPSQGAFGIPDAQVVYPGKPYHSVLLYRLAKMGKGRMPYLGSTLVDERGVQLIEEWISQLGAEKAAAIPVSSAISNTAEALAISCSLRSCSDQTRRTVLAAVARSANPLITDVFERFLPEDQRRKTLGGTVRPEVVLALAGDIDRGRKLFAADGGGQCHSCHAAEKVGREFGPDLTHIGKKFTREQLLEHILHPSLSVEPQFIGWTLESDSESLTGIVLTRNEREVVLRDAQSERRFKVSEIARLEPLKTSLMPEGLLQGLTTQEAADLLAYLESLK